MRVLVIPDVHLRHWMFDRADKILAMGQADRAISLGDLADDWGEETNFGLYSRTLQRAVRFQKEHPDTLWICGNHDYGYWHPDYGVRETGHSKLVEGEMLTYLQELERKGGHQKVIYIVDNCVFSHAGLTKSWAKRQMMLAAVPMAERNENSLKIAANFAAPAELWQEDSPIWVRPQYEHLEMYPEGKLQVVGHTPVVEAGVKWGVLSTDTFSTYSDGAPIGNQRFVIVDTVTKDWTYAEEDNEHGDA